MQQGDCSPTMDGTTLKTRQERETWTCGRKGRTKKRHFVTSSSVSVFLAVCHCLRTWYSKARAVALPCLTDRYMLLLLDCHQRSQQHAGDGTHIMRSILASKRADGLEPPPSLSCQSCQYPYATHETLLLPRRCCDQSKSGGRVYVALPPFFSRMQCPCFFLLPRPPACSTTLRPFFFFLAGEPGGVDGESKIRLHRSYRKDQGR